MPNSSSVELVLEKKISINCMCKTWLSSIDDNGHYLCVFSKDIDTSTLGLLIVKVY